MYRATALVLVLACSSLVAAAPITPGAAVSSSSSDTAVATTQTANANVAAPLVNAVPEQSETYLYVPELMHAPEKARRRSFRRRHP
ncbi:hypothetical protein GGX14DRAFT_569380 [Mycena pura]|uniref:Uncharacterized protein n=1 Tax=Mycena pura TaxID=153505 RepID=A0AAD6V7I5_9AGAR|nr:hypothetical protein GGX14DRAFT_569380 [Mycena pura]